MLPFLRNKKQVAGVIVRHREPDEKQEHDEAPESDSLEVAASEMMRAIESGDSKAFSKALRSAFAIMESEPHEEGEHTNDEDESFDAQNIKAAKESR